MEISKTNINTDDYRNAPSKGPLNNTWRDKPHRLIYDLCNEIDRLRSVQPNQERPQHEIYELSKLLQKRKDRIALSWEQVTLRIDDVVYVPDENGILIYVNRL